MNKEKKQTYITEMTSQFEKSEAVIACELNTYLISKAQNLVFFESSLTKLEKHLV